MTIEYKNNLYHVNGQKFDNYINAKEYIDYMHSGFECPYKANDNQQGKGYIRNALLAALMFPFLYGLLWAAVALSVGG